MKKLIVITLILMSLLQTIIGQEKNEAGLITSGKWYLESVENSGQKRTLPTEEKENNWMKFHSDGKHEVMAFSKLVLGEWQYSKDKRTIIMTNTGRVVNEEIITLNDNELVLKIKDDEIEILKKFKK